MMGTSHSESGFVLGPTLSISANNSWGVRTSARIMDPDRVNASSVASIVDLSKFHKAIEIAAILRETFLAASSCAVRYIRSRSCNMVRAVTTENIRTLVQITQKRIRAVSRDCPRNRMMRLSIVRSGVERQLLHG